MTVSKSSSRVSVPSGLRCRVRLADGRVFTGELPPERHRALQLGLLHAHGDGLVEIAAGERRDGRLAIITRPRADQPARADHFVAGGATGGKDWLGRLLALVERHARLGREVFAAPALRSTPHPAKTAVTHTRVLWVDVDSDDPTRPKATSATAVGTLQISVGSGGVHAYWRLTHPLPSQQTIDGTLIEPIERAHTRISLAVVVGVLDVRRALVVVVAGGPPDLDEAVAFVESLRASVGHKGPQLQPAR